MTSFEIVKPGIITTVQDLGRDGLAYYAIPTSGAMDRNSAKIALLLLDKSEENPLIECTSIAPQIRFNAATRIVLAGADFGWNINNKEVNRNTVLKINKDNILRGEHAKDGLRGYIAFEGDLIVDRVYNSHSTYINAKIGGFQGRLLKKGDTIEWKNSETSILKNDRLIPIQKGPEFNSLTEYSKLHLTSEYYKIGPDSNRMGIRLHGRKLESTIYQLEDSLPVLPGFIQLTPNKLPIIVLQDGQTIGGYPRIAYVQEKYLSRLNQIPIGGKLKFKLNL